MNDVLKKVLLRKNQDDIIKFLKAGHDPLKEEHENKPFIFWVITLKLVKVFDYLAENHQATLAQKFSGKSCWEAAISVRAFEIAMKLISPSININFQDSQGKTPLHLLMEHYDDKYIKELDEKHKNQSEVLKNNLTLFLKQLFSLNPINLKDGDGNTIKEIIKGNQLASKAFDEYNFDLMRIKAYLSVPQNKLMPRELVNKTLLFMVPTYILSDQKEKYIVNLFNSDLQNSTQDRPRSPKN